MKYYLLGIKGSGMSALAQILNDLNEKVLGCDFNKYFFTEEELLKKNIVIEDIDKMSYDKNFFYIVGNSFLDKIYFKKLLDYNLRYNSYPLFLENHVPGKKIVISGTHGKTTTTKLTSCLFSQEKCNILIGDGSGKGINNAEYFIFEGCEYKDTFLNYSPYFLGITNIELDHVDYFKNLDNVILSFNKLIDKSSYIVIKDEEFKKLKRNKTNNIITYGIDGDYKTRYEKIKTGYKLIINNQINLKNYELDLNFYSSFMLDNFLISFIIAIENGIRFSSIIKNIALFKMPKRRFEEYHFKDHILIDDYAHHPTEIKKSIEQAKEKYPDKKIIAIFEPHTYNRYSYFYNEFINSLKLADEFYIENIFSSNRENLKIDDITTFKYKISSDILNKLKQEKNTVILILSAGEVTRKYLELFNK